MLMFFFFFNYAFKKSLIRFLGFAIIVRGRRRIMAMGTEKVEDGPTA